jgi:acyl-CoA synthetase (AMP-forming)/AMP-acid ligase II
MISHYNVIANTMQICTCDQVSRDWLKAPGEDIYLENALGLLPLSHIYGLVVIAHASAYRGDGVVVLPKFELKSFLAAVQDYKINTLYIVPPIVITMTNQRSLLDQYDFSHVKAIFTGSAPLGKETAEDLLEIFPKWIIRQGYGLTETSTVVCSTAHFDVWTGSSGSLVTDIETRLVSPEGDEITEYGQPGELLVKSPAVVLGYLNNEKANRATFEIDGNGDRWLRTGDEVIIKKGPSGHEHLFIVDRIKELIKVKVSKAYVSTTCPI